MIKRSCCVLQKGERGLYFPINHRIIDCRIAPCVGAEQADVQSRYRRELRTSFVTGETRQTVAPQWSAAERPTHFLSLRLPPRNGLVARVEEIHNHILFSHQNYFPLFVPLPRLHITIGVMTIPSENQESIVSSIRESIVETMSGIQPLRLRFRGLGTFNYGRVLFVRTIPEADFHILDTAVSRLRKKIGIHLGVDMKGNPYDSYVPHITVAKIRPSQRKEFGDRIPAALWAEFQHNDFGDVTFSRVDLCAMRGTSADGYYHTLNSVELDASL